MRETKVNYKISRDELLDETSKMNRKMLYWAVAGALLIALSSGGIVEGALTHISMFAGGFSTCKAWIFFNTSLGLENEIKKIDEMPE